MSKKRAPKKTWEPPEFAWSLRGPVPVEYTDEILDEQGKRLAGCAHIYGRKIVVDAGLPQEEVEAVLMHEALHIWAHDSGFDAVFEDLDEPFIQSMASFVVAYLKYTR